MLSFRLPIGASVMPTVSSAETTIARKTIR